jgi:hypothetical protein
MKKKKEENTIENVTAVVRQIEINDQETKQKRTNQRTNTITAFLKTIIINNNLLSHDDVDDDDKRANE